MKQSKHNSNVKNCTTKCRVVYENVRKFYTRMGFYWDENGNFYNLREWLGMGIIFCMNRCELEQTNLIIF